MSLFAKEKAQLRRKGSCAEEARSKMKTPTEGENGRGFRRLCNKKRSDRKGDPGHGSTRVRECLFIRFSIRIQELWFYYKVLFPKNQIDFPHEKIPGDGSFLYFKSMKKNRRFPCGSFHVLGGSGTFIPENNGGSNTNNERFICLCWQRSQPFQQWCMGRRLWSPIR